MDSRITVGNLIDEAKNDICRMKNATDNDRKKTFALCAIAESLTAIAMDMTKEVKIFGSEQARWLNGE